MSSLPQRPDQRFTGNTPLGPSAAASGLLGIKSAKELNVNPSGSPYTMFTFPAAGRLWNASVSYTLASGPSFAGPTQNGYCQIITGSGVTLAVVELVVTDPNQIDSGQSDQPLGGISVLKGDTLLFDLNNGVSIANTTQRASGFVIYSVP